MLTTEQIEGRLNSIDQKIKGITILIDRLNTNVEGRANITDLNRSIEELRELIRSNATLLSSFEEKLSKIVLPEDTRYYLDQGEVSSFQSNFNTLKAMLNKFDQLYKNLVAYQSKLKSS
jgi:methyl-accepting chemotaxis protein